MKAGYDYYDSKPAPHKGLAESQSRVDCSLVGNQGGHVGHSDRDARVERRFCVILITTKGNTTKTPCWAVNIP